MKVVLVNFKNGERLTFTGKDPQIYSGGLNSFITIKDGDKEIALFQEDDIRSAYVSRIKDNGDDFNVYDINIGSDLTDEQLYVFVNELKKHMRV